MIIGLHLEENAFEQDIRELLMAFYPGSRFVYGDLETASREAAGEGGLDRMVTGEFIYEKDKVQYRLNLLRIGKAGEDSGKTEGESLWKKKALSPVMLKGLEEGEKNLPFPVERENRGETKNRIKRRLYFLLMLDTGKELPWGALTGIRPVKIPEAKLQEGWPEEKILDFMEANYLTG